MYSQASPYRLFDLALFKKYRDKDKVLRSHPSFRDLRAAVRRADGLCERLRGSCPPDRLAAFLERQPL
jgi:hypothetical protein